jgi:hypothetical protein
MNVVHQLPYWSYFQCLLCPHATTKWLALVTSKWLVLVTTKWLALVTTKWLGLVTTK